jgi:predicted nucleotidyltransferase
MMLVPEVARDYANCMRLRFGERLEQVRVFGSYARGEAHEESDLDVLVVVRDLDRAEKLAALEQAAEVALGKGIALNALVMNASEHARLLSLQTRLVLDIAREGVSL